MKKKYNKIAAWVITIIVLLYVISVYVDIVKTL